MRKPCPCMYMTVEPEAALKIKILDQSPSETLAFELCKNSFCTGSFSWWISPCQDFYGGPKLISAWPLQLRSLATFNRSVQNISESLLKLHTVTPPKKRKNIQRYMLPKLVSLGIILGPPPFHHLGGLSELLSPPRAAWAVRPCGESRGGFRRSASLRTLAGGVHSFGGAEMIGLWVLHKTFGGKPPHTEIRMPGTGGPGIRWNFLLGFTQLPKKWEESLVVYQDQHAQHGRGGVVQLIITWSCKKTPPKKRVKIYARILANNILKAFHQLNFSETSKDPGVSKVFLQCPLDGFPIQPSKNVYQTATDMLWQSRSYQKETENPWNVWFWEMHL